MKKEVSNTQFQKVSDDIFSSKYAKEGETRQDVRERVAKALALVEGTYAEPGQKRRSVTLKYYKQFLYALENGFIPAGRILANAGRPDKPNVSLISCAVSPTIGDSIKEIGGAVAYSMQILSAGIGIGYEFSSIRPRGAWVRGAGAKTSGILPFMDIFDKACLTISSAGSRRGAQMATCDVNHPDLLDFIQAKKEQGRFSQFNLSVLITDEFLEAVKRDEEWLLSFPITKDQGADIQTESPEYIYRDFRSTADLSNYIVRDDGRVLCKVYSRMPARDIYDLIMKANYDYGEPGVILIDTINRENNSYFFEEIRATNPCAEQPLPPWGVCLLGSINLLEFIVRSDKGLKFNWTKFRKIVGIAHRALDNVVDISNLPLPELTEHLERTRRHGLGFIGVGSVLNLLGIRYGSKKALTFVEKTTKIMAVEGLKVGVDLAKEKAPAPALNSRVNKTLFSKGAYMSRLLQESEKTYPTIRKNLMFYGCRYTHATSIAPTGTISVSMCNNASNGIEPTYTHQYKRNIISPTSKSKLQQDVYSAEYIINGTSNPIPENWSTIDNITVDDHLLMQATAQKWVDSGISKTVNVPVNYAFDDFKKVHMRAWELGLKGCATYRPNPNQYNGVLVKEEDLKRINYEVILENGEKMILNGNDKVMYDGESHVMANLADSINNGYYGVHKE